MLRCNAARVYLQKFSVVHFRVVTVVSAGGAVLKAKNKGAEMRIQPLLAGVALAAVMNVAQGTILFVGVDPATGEARFYLAPGQMQYQSGPDQPSITLYPNQSVSIDNQLDDVQSPTVSDGVVDIDALISNTSNAIIEAIVSSKAAIDQENAAYVAKLQNASEREPNQEAINRINNNLDNLVGNIVKNAISQGKFDEQQIQVVIDRINQQLDKKLDLDNVKPAQLSEQETAKQAQRQRLEAERNKRLELEKRRQQELKEQNEALQKKLKEQLERQKAEKEKAAEAAKKKVAEEHAKKLADQAAKDAFEAKQKALEAKQKQAQQGTQDEQSPPDNQASGPSRGASGSAPGAAGTQGGDDNPGNQAGTPAGGAVSDPASDDRYDPHAPVDGRMLQQLVDGSPLPRITPPSLAGMLRETMAAPPDDGNRPSDGERDADQAAEDRLLRDFVEQVAALDAFPPIAALDDFPHIGAGDVSALPPTESLTGESSATYNGQLSGAFSDGTPVSGALSLGVDFHEHLVMGSIDFGGNGIADVGGEYPASENRVLLPFYGDIFGGSGHGQLRGEFYGPQGQELGGNWDMSISGPSSEGQNAEGQFATKQ